MKYLDNIHVYKRRKAAKEVETQIRELSSNATQWVFFYSIE